MIDAMDPSVKKSNGTDSKPRTMFNYLIRSNCPTFHGNFNFWHFWVGKEKGRWKCGEIDFFKKTILINNLSCLGFRFLLEKIAKAKSIPEDTVICHLRHSNCLTSLGGKSHFRCLKLHMWHSIEPQKTSHLDILGHYSPFFLVHFRPH